MNADEHVNKQAGDFEKRGSKANFSSAFWLVHVLSNKGRGVHVFDEDRNRKARPRARCEGGDTLARKIPATCSTEERPCMSASTLTIMSSRCTKGMDEMSVASITETSFNICFSSAAIDWSVPGTT